MSGLSRSGFNEFQIKYLVGKPIPMQDMTYLQTLQQEIEERYPKAYEHFLNINLANVKVEVKGEEFKKLEAHTLKLESDVQELNVKLTQAFEAQRAFVMAQGIAEENPSTIDAMIKMLEQMKQKQDKMTQNLSLFAITSVRCQFKIGLSLILRSMDPLITENLDELKTRTREYIKYERIMNFHKEGLFLLWLLMPLVFGAAMKVLSSLEAVFLVALGLVLAVLSVKLPELKLKDYPVEDDEWARLYSYGIYNSLVEYFNTEAVGMKNKARTKARIYARSFLIVLEERWKVGDFKLVRNFENVISEFRRNWRYRVVPTLGSDKPDLLRRVSRLMYNLFWWSKSLTIGNIETMNKEMAEVDETKLPSDEPPKTDYRTIVRGMKTKYKNLEPYGVPLAFSAIPAIVLGLLLMRYTDVDLSTTLIVTVALFSGLLVFFSSAGARVHAQHTLDM
jgi:hypothetical protein